MFGGVLCAPQRPKLKLSGLWSAKIITGDLIHLEVVEK